MPASPPSGSASADARAIYDAIMREIEPDLTTEMIPTLAEKYATEPEAARMERAKRYNEAFAAYDKEYAAYSKRLDEDLRRRKKEAVEKAEETTRVKEDAHMRELEASMSMQ